MRSLDSTVEKECLEVVELEDKARVEDACETESKKGTSKTCQLEEILRDPLNRELPRFEDLD